MRHGLGVPALAHAWPAWTSIPLVVSHKGSYSPSWPEQPPRYDCSANCISESLGSQTVFNESGSAILHDPNLNKVEVMFSGISACQAYEDPLVSLTSQIPTTFWQRQGRWLILCFMTTLQTDFLIGSCDMPTLSSLCYNSTCQDLPSHAGPCD